MKQIIFFRHGKVNMKDNQKISAFEFKKWIDKYNNCDIILDKRALDNKNIVDKSDAVICSNLKRSIQSANFFGKKPLKQDDIFNEAGIPYLNWTKLKLSPRIWLIIFRILWLFGYSKNCESYKEAKQRAKKASLELIKLSKEYDNIVLFGHGIFNRLLLKEMMLNNWEIKKKLKSKNWGYGIIEQNR